MEQKIKQYEIIDFVEFEANNRQTQTNNFLLIHYFLSVPKT